MLFNSSIIFSYTAHSENRNFSKQVKEAMACCNPFSSEDATPLPYGIVSVVFLIKFLLTTTNAMCFSYLPKLVKSFDTREVDIGYNVGFLGAALNVGQVSSYFLWGFIGDRYGRKRTILVGVFGIMGTGLLFGFSTNFYWALCSRFLFGLNMGMCSVIKSILVLACDSTILHLLLRLDLGLFTKSKCCKLPCFSC